ncbi:MAG: hypothetical protein ACU83O_07585 [Gammaproteobacteria bacterium]
MSQINNMTNVEYFWMLIRQGIEPLWILQRYVPCYINYVLFVAAIVAAIAQRAYTDAKNLQVLALLALPVFVLIVGTLGSWANYGKGKVIIPPDFDGTWHQTIIYDKEPEPDSDHITKVKKWFQYIVSQFDPRGRSIPINLISAALLFHIAALCYLLYALPNFRYFIIAMWGFISWQLHWAILVSKISITGNWP